MIIISDDYKNLIQSLRAIHHYKYTNSKCTSSDMNADTGKRIISKGLLDNSNSIVATIRYRSNVHDTMGRLVYETSPRYRNKC